MSIIDVIKKSVLAQFEQAITIEDMVLSLLVAFLISIFIIVVYKKSFSGVVYNKSSVLTITLISMTTAMIIRTINSNLSLSLGMVGALSIVRFRTAIKDPVDTSFLFWAITAGIMSGAGLYLIALAGSILVGILYYVLYALDVKAKSQYLLVVVLAKSSEDEVDLILNGLTKKKLKSRSCNSNGNVELTYEVKYDENSKEVIKQLEQHGAVKTVNLVTYTNDYGL